MDRHDDLHSAELTHGKNCYIMMDSCQTRQVCWKLALPVTVIDLKLSQ